MIVNICEHIYTYAHMHLYMCMYAYKKPAKSVTFFHVYSFKADHFAVGNY